MGVGRLRGNSARIPVMGIDRDIVRSLREFGVFINQADWRGKENDVVNTFAHRFLAKRVRPLDRIGIEVGVPQLGGKGRKQAVRKDLVIWKRGGQTTWDKNWKAKAVPQAILEWKVKRGLSAKATISARDRAWLTGFKSKHRGFVGVCVTVAFGKKTEVKWEIV
jgi:hypothetical protein